MLQPTGTLGALYCEMCHNANVDKTIRQKKIARNKSTNYCKVGLKTALGDIPVAYPEGEIRKEFYKHNY